MSKNRKRKNGEFTYFSSVESMLFDFACAAAETIKLLSGDKKKRKGKK